jgi:hypothetical protein
MPLSRTSSESPDMPLIGWGNSLQLGIGTPATAEGSSSACGRLTRLAVSKLLFEEIFS